MQNISLEDFITVSNTLDKIATRHGASTNAELNHGLELLFASRECFFNAMTDADQDEHVDG